MESSRGVTMSSFINDDFPRVWDIKCLLFGKRQVFGESRTAPVKISAGIESITRTEGVPSW